MKKGLSQAKVQRMRNLVSGNHTAKSKVSSGYTKKSIERVEGDVWEERGKKWTIKNGIKRTVNKLDFARKVNRVPFKCPKCTNKLNHPAHKTMYKRWGMCLTCVTKWEQQMQADGTYDAWHSEFDKENFNAYIDNVTLEYNEWVEARGAQSFVTEAGQVEEWSGGESSDKLKQEFAKVITDVKEKRNAKVD
tara:strand:+ start:229 stop:801 length:573 start_codon:yes stop_codon:yes gene_type:complete